MNKKRFIIALLTIIITFAVTTTATASDNVNVLIDGVPLEQITTVDVPARLHNGRTFAPLRAVANALGLTVNHNSGVVTFQDTDRTITHVIGTTHFDIHFTDGTFRTETTGVPSFLHDSRTLVPIRAVSQSTGATVRWDSATRTDTPTDDPDIVHLDATTSTWVYRSNVVARLSQQLVRHNTPLPPTVTAFSFTTPPDSHAPRVDQIVYGTHTYITLEDAAARYTPFDPRVSPETLAERATAIMNAITNVDHRTIHGPTWWASIEPYYSPYYRTASGLTGQQSFTGPLTESVQRQGLTMTAVFVTSPDLVYITDDTLANLDAGGIYRQEAHFPFTVRGTIYYKIESATNNDGFWYIGEGTHNNWYRVDVDVRFGMPDLFDGTLAYSSIDVMMFLGNDGTIRFNGDPRQDITRAEVHTR